MRLMILTNVAVAALAALCFQVGAQDSGPRLDQKKASPAAESNQAATSQRRNVTPERAERPAAEPMNSSVAQPEMKGRDAAKQVMKSATGPAEKAMPGEAAKKRNAGEGSMHKASAGKQPATTQGKTGEQGRRATNATEGTGIEAETKTAPRSNDRRRATEGGHHVTSSQGEVQTPRKSRGYDMTGGRSATAGSGNEQTSAKSIKLNERQPRCAAPCAASPSSIDFSLSTGTVVPRAPPGSSHLATAYQDLLPLRWSWPAKERKRSALQCQISSNTTQASKGCLKAARQIKPYYSPPRDVNKSPGKDRPS
jgi:hypothetical protein